MDTLYKEHAERILRRCAELAAISDVPGETTRLFLSPATRRVHELLTRWMVVARLEVRVDAAGNLRGVLEANADAPRLVLGSHIDTIPNAGPYDGILGVVIGLELMERMAASGPLPYSMELVCFSEEEGVRFAKPFIGCLALIGELDAAMLQRTDADGVSVEQAIRDFGLDPARLADAVSDPATSAYLEFHIEQGPVLESENLPLGVVDAIAGQTRATLTFTGQSNHAGTTPMGPLRHDALAAAAEWIVEVERYANQTPGLVATTGKLDVPASAGNVIAGRCLATLDVRHANDAIRLAAVDHLLNFSAKCGAKRRVSVTQTTTLDQAGVPMDRRLTELLAQSAAKVTGIPPRIMTSGAGHDAMVVARRIPSAMLFLRSPAGLSHHPAESVIPEDVEAAFAVGIEFLKNFGGISGSEARSGI